MALTTYHHGVTATETSNVTPIIKSVSTSTIALVSTSIDADDAKYPLDTPVLLTGITTDDVDKAGAKDALLSQCLQTIKSIQNTSVVVLRLSEPVDVTTVDTLLSCQSRLGITPKIFIAPEIDTPTMTRKLVEIAKKRRGFVYASPRMEDGSLITAKEDIVAYRDTFAARELMLIEGDFGEPGKLSPSDGLGGDGGVGDVQTDLINFIKFDNSETIKNPNNTYGLAYSIDGGPIETITSEGQLSDFTIGYFLNGLADSTGYYADDGLLDYNERVPEGLDLTAAYLFGLSSNYLNLSLQIKGDLSTPVQNEKETVITLYPFSIANQAFLGFDIFDLIIDPADYTSNDIQHFAEHKIRPAIKNEDGAYTLRSQVNTGINF